MRKKTSLTFFPGEREYLISNAEGSWSGMPYQANRECPAIRIINDYKYGAADVTECLKTDTWDDICGMTDDARKHHEFFAENLTQIARGEISGWKLIAISIDPISVDLCYLDTNYNGTETASIDYERGYVRIFVESDQVSGDTKSYHITVEKSHPGEQITTVREDDDSGYKEYYFRYANLEKPFFKPFVDANLYPVEVLEVEK